MPLDWKAWMNWNPPLKTISQAMTTTTPHEVANGSAIAKNPKAMSRIAQTIDFPEPSSESAVGAIVSSFLFLFLLDLASVYLLHELPEFAKMRGFCSP
jgi:hypothetical protein